MAVSHLERITGWGGECDEQFARLRHAGVVRYTGELAGGAGPLPLQAVAQRIAYVVDCEHVVLLAGRPLADPIFTSMIRRDPRPAQSPRTRRWSSQAHNRLG